MGEPGVARAFFNTADTFLHPPPPSLATVQTGMTTERETARCPARARSGSAHSVRFAGHMRSSIDFKIPRPGPRLARVRACLCTCARARACMRLTCARRTAHGDIDVDDRWISIARDSDPDV